MENYIDLLVTIDVYWWILFQLIYRLGVQCIHLFIYSRYYCITIVYCIPSCYLIPVLCEKLYRAKAPANPTTTTHPFVRYSYSIVLGGIVVVFR